MRLPFGKSSKHPAPESEKPPALPDSGSTNVVPEHRIVFARDGPVPASPEKEKEFDEGGNDTEWVLKRYWVKYISLEIPLVVNREHLCKDMLSHARCFSSVRLHLIGASK